MIELIKKLIRDEEGARLGGIRPVAGLPALAAIAILPTLGSSVNKIFSQFNRALNAS